MVRISVNELYQLMDEERNPVIVDVRSNVARNLDLRHIPGAIIFEISELDQKLSQLPTNREVILYCTCSNEASAVHVARLLFNKGFTRVRLLEGGFDAWVAAGFEIEGFNYAPRSRS